MIIPSIDLRDGHAVQLIGGREQAIDAGDPLPIARTFRLAGEIAVVDLDAALGRGENRAIMRTLCEIAPCRVGGGIRDVNSAIEWLDAGARKVVLGTAARPEILRDLPRDRIIAALDAREGEVVVEGWTRSTGAGIVERMKALRNHVGGFLVTIVEREGRMAGVDLELAEQLREAAGDCDLTIAGGVRSAEEIAALDRMRIDAQVGMALYTGAMSLADALAAPLQTDRPDGTWPTVVVDDHGMALGLAYSNHESLREAIETQRGVYWSRSRKEIWRKGAMSGATQDLLRIDLDCDRDTLRFTVHQHGSGFCHRGTWSCWGSSRGLALLERTIAERARTAPAGSYTRRVLTDESLLDAKLSEETGELIAAATDDETVHEAADLLYFILIKLHQAGLSLADVERELDRRSLRITRRGGDAKDIEETQP